MDHHHPHRDINRSHYRRGSPPFRHALGWLQLLVILLLHNLTLHPKDARSPFLRL